MTLGIFVQASNHVKARNNAAGPQFSEVHVKMHTAGCRYVTSSCFQDGSDGGSILSEGSTSVTVEMDCIQEQQGGSCGMKRQNTTSLNAEAVPAHIEAAIQDLLQAVNRVQSMADSLRAAIAPGLVSPSLFCTQFCFLFQMTVTSCVCRSGLGMESRITKGFHCGPRKYPGKYVLLAAQNISTPEPAE